jgi:hypothetical protein
MLTRRMPASCVQQPQGPGSQSSGARFAGLVNLDAQALKRGGDILLQQQQQQQRKSAPMGQMKWQPN